MIVQSVEHYRKNDVQVHAGDDEGDNTCNRSETAFPQVQRRHDVHEGGDQNRTHQRVFNSLLDFRRSLVEYDRHGKRMQAMEIEQVASRRP